MPGDGSSVCRPFPTDESESDDRPKARVRQRCPVNYESSHSLLSFILVSFDLPSLFPTLPLPSRRPPQLILFQKKKTSQKKRPSVKFPDPLRPSPKPSLLSRLITTISRSNSTRTLASTISHHTFTTVPRLRHGRQHHRDRSRLGH